MVKEKSNKKKEDVLVLDENQVELVKAYGDFIESINALRYSFLKNGQNMQVIINFYANTNNFEIINASSLINVPPEKNGLIHDELQDQDSTTPVNNFNENIPFKKADYLG